MLSQGRIEQVGTPQQIYLEPASRFVAEFVGLSNLLDGTVVGRTNGVTGFGVATSGLNLLSSCPPPAGASASILIRPERVLLAPPLSGDAANVFQAQVQQATYLGEDAQFRLLVDGQPR